MNAAIVFKDMVTGVPAQATPIALFTFGNIAAANASAAILNTQALTVFLSDSVSSNGIGFLAVQVDGPVTPGQALGVLGTVYEGIVAP